MMLQQLAELRRYDAAATNQRPFEANARHAMRNAAQMTAQMNGAAVVERIGGQRAEDGRKGGLHEPQIGELEVWRPLHVVGKTMCAIIMCVMCVSRLILLVH